MSLGAAGCGYEYRNHNGVCKKLSATRDGYYCDKFKEHLAYKEIHEYVSKDVTDLTMKMYKHPVRLKVCGGLVK